MANLINSVKKRVRKWFSIEDKVAVDVPLGPILSQLSTVKYGDELSVIAHAGGGTQLNGQSARLYTNSREAVLDSIEDGKKLIELDLHQTSDAQIVAIHSWAEFKAETAYQGLTRKVLHDDTPLSLDTFLHLRETLDFKPLHLDEITTIFESNPECYLVIDKIRDISLLSNSIAFKSKVILEVFTVGDYDRAYRSGFENIVMNIDVKKRKIDQWVKNNNIKAVTLSAQAIDSHPRGYANTKLIYDYGVIVLAYSSNDDEFMQRNIGTLVSSVYSDYWSLKMKGSRVLGGNTTY